jgi:hypothetical protein
LGVLAENAYWFEFWKGAFGDKSIQYKTMLISIPQLALPVLLYFRF